MQKAVAVHFVKDGTEQVVRVNDEVVISAGTFKSPQVVGLTVMGERIIDFLKLTSLSS